MSGAVSRKSVSQSTHVGTLPDDLYLQFKLWPRLGRPPKDDLKRWRVTDDWPEIIPVPVGEIDVFEAWFGDIFDELFGPEPMS